MNYEANSQEKDRIVKKLLGLKPRGVICPYCGSVEYISPTFSLEKYTGYEKFIVPCTKIRNGRTTIWFENESIHIKTVSICDRCDLYLSKYEYYSNAIICTDAPVIKWDIRFSAPGVGVEKCSNCNINCSLSKEDNSTWKYLTVGFLFDEEEYFGIVPKEEKKMTPTTEGTNPFMKFMTTTPLQKLEPVKDWCTKHKTTLQWVVPVGAVAIAAKMLKENKELVDKGKAMGLPFLDKKAKITRLATLGGTYAIAYGLSKTLLNSDKEGLKEATGKVEELATKHPRFATRAEEVLPTAISVLIAYAMTEKPQWAERTFESSSAFYDNLKVGFVLAKDYVFDKAGIDDEQAKKICICLGVSFALVALYKGAQKKEELSEMAEKFVDFSIKVTKTLAPPVFASIASVLVYMNLWPDEVIDAITEIDEEDEDADTDTADEDCTD